MRHHVTKSETTVHAALGDEIIVEVPEQTGGGYEWMILTPIPHGIETFEIASIIPSGAGFGAASIRQFGFSVVSPGRYVITLMHCRSWEGLANAIGSFTVKIET